MSTEHETEETPEETAETFIPALGRPSSRVTQSAFRQPAVETPPKPDKGLISQGVRTEHRPRPYVSPDELIRNARHRGGWSAIF